MEEKEKRDWRGKWKTGGGESRILDLVLKEKSLNLRVLFARSRALLNNMTIKYVEEDMLENVAFFIRVSDRG